MSAPKLEVTIDRTEEFKKLIKKYKNDLVLVGIPAEDTDRKEQDQEITNAALLAINEFGSPINNIPPRPVMAIGIRNAQEEIAAQFGNALKLSLRQGLSALSIYYNRIGSIASNSVKKAINAQEGFPPLSQSTLDGRAARGFKGTKALIVTGQMRNAITYVVKGEV